MSDVLRAQLQALRATAAATIAAIDCALGEDAAPDPPAPAGRCPHDGTDRVIVQRGMGDAPAYDFCLDCNRALPAKEA